jgi:hypothetical protein
VKKVIIGDTLGIFIILFGIVIGIIYFQNRADASPEMVIPPVLMVLLGLLLFFGKRMHKLFSKVTKFDTSLSPAEIAANEKKFADRLQKNNEIVAEWTKTNKTREELKLLQAAEASKQE